jgi:hypothetical protein
MTTGTYKSGATASLDMEDFLETLDTENKGIPFSKMSFENDIFWFCLSLCFGSIDITLLLTLYIDSVIYFVLFEN